MLGCGSNSTGLLPLVNDTPAPSPTEDVPLICGFASDSSITPTFVASRLTGVAPLAVFFDATQTVANSTSKPFHELIYSWNFGEILASGIANWGAGSNTSAIKNVASGPMASHVFETPGTYTVCMSVSNGIKTVAAKTTITVTDPNLVFSGTNTICVSSSSLPVPGVADCPVGAAVALQTEWATIINSYKGTNKRILLKGGDTFLVSTNPSNIANPGPTQVSSYGSGRAKIQNNNFVGQYFLWQDGAVSDFRIINLEIDGMGQSPRLMAVINGGISNLLFLNNFIHHIGEGIKVDQSTADGIFIVGNTIQDVIGGSGRQGTYLTGNRAAIQGNIYDNFEKSEHPIRLAGTTKVVISNNNISGAPDGTQNGAVGSKETLAIRLSGARNPQFILISENDFYVEGFSGLVLRENASDVIAERNHYRASGGQSFLIENNATRVTYRNEIVNATGVGGAFLLRDILDGTPSTEIFVYNNSIFTSSSTGSFTGITVNTGNTSGSNIVKNNLQYTPSIPGSVVVLRDLSNATVNSHNTTNSQSVSTNPGWIINSPMMPLTRYRPANSYAVQGGTTVSVFTDFFNTIRTGALTLGALNP